MNCYIIIHCIIIVLVLIISPIYGLSQNPAGWPQATEYAKPWTRWWWPGNAVDSVNLKRELMEMYEAGIGGVEITSIYGVKGEENRFIEYSSPEFTRNIQYTIQEANKLGMGVDLPPGSGWRLGGPFVPEDKGLWVLKIHQFSVGKNEKWNIPDGITNAVLLSFVDSEGKIKELSFSEAFITPSEGTVYVAERIKKGEKVKRASVGGEGLAIDTFEEEVIEWYLKEFWQRLGLEENFVRAFFHDSFEYTGDFTPNFAEAFKTRRGYNLAQYLHVLAGEGNNQELHDRVISDYRQTLGELVLESFIHNMEQWVRSHQSLFRNQGHGSPGNVLDIYAACDIPETEIYGRIKSNEVNIFVNKFASSAAHITGKKLVSSESYTWLNEHWNVTPADMMRATNRLFLAGVNHMIFHGTCYSPEDAQWPGWLFYASTQINNRNPLWRQFPYLFGYINRAQSVLQQAEPLSDLLVYWPYYDVIAKEKGRLFFSLNIDHGDESAWFKNYPLALLSRELMEKGYDFDYVSDLQLMNSRIENGMIVTEGGARYKAVVLPATTYIPFQTMQQLNDLIAAGGKIYFDKSLPEMVPGLKNFEERQLLLNDIKSSPAFKICTGNVLELLSKAGIRGEFSMVDKGLHYNKMIIDGEVWYMLANCGDTGLDEWIVPETNAVNYVFYFPENGKISMASVKEQTIRVQLDPERIVFLRCTNNKLDIPSHDYFEKGNTENELEGLWRISFIEGGPVFPGDLTTRKLVSWTEIGDENAVRFAGTAKYSMEFFWKETTSKGLLDLGVVHNCAKVLVNGKEIGSLMGPSYKVLIDNLKQGVNILEVEVTNTAANRIRDLDIRGIEWRKFYDINFIGIGGKKFDASQWTVQKGGLEGKVTLSPL